MPVALHTTRKGAAQARAIALKPLVTNLKREDKAHLVALIVVAGFFLAVAWAYFCGAYFGIPYPQNNFLFNPGDAGNDFFHLFRSVKSGYPYRYEWSLYLPFTYIPLVLLSAFSQGLAYFICFGLFSFFVFKLLYGQLHFLARYQRILIAFSLAFLTYPYLFVLDRGNLEAFIFIAIYLFIVSYQREKLKWAVFFLASAASMKAYPLVLGLLFLKKKKYIYFGATILFALVLTLASAAFFPEGIVGSFQSISIKLVRFKHDYILGDGVLPYTASYFNVLKVVAAKLHPLSPADLDRILPFYTGAALIMLSLIALYVLFCERTLWKTVALLVCAFILLPQITGDYKLIHLLFPMILFVASEEEGRFDFTYAVIFGLLLIPKAFAWIRYNDAVQLIPISNLLNPLLMTVMMALIIYEGINRRAKDRTACA